jgi:hypothetical protein
MYYAESVNAEEIAAVTEHMRESMVTAGFADNISAAHTMLITWSKLIKTQFDIDNLGITAAGRANASGGNDQLLATLQQVSLSNQTMSIEARRTSQAQSEAIQRLQAQVENLTSRVQFSQRDNDSPSKTKRTALTAFGGETTKAQVSEVSEQLDSPLPFPSNSSSSLSTNLNPLNSLSYFPGASAKPGVTVLKKLGTISYFEMTIKGPVNLSDSDKTRGDTVVKLFNAVATKDDKLACQSNIPISVRSAVGCMTLFTHWE